MLILADWGGGKIVIVETSMLKGQYRHDQSRQGMESVS